METSRNIMHCAIKWLHPKNTDQNLVSALIHMLSISLLSMSLVELKWFEISTATQAQGLCAPFLSITQFFTYGYTATDEGAGVGATDVCVTWTTVNMMRIIILLSFMAMIFSLCGFYMEVASPQAAVYVFMRRYALASTCTVLWIMATVASCYYVAILLEEAFIREFPASEISVTYGYGFYLVAVTGALNLLGTFFSLLFMHTSALYHHTGSATHDDTYPITADDAITSHPPPYNFPPPPYHP